MTDLLAVADTLCKMPRVGWLQRGVGDAETVCAHSLLVILLAGEIAARLNAEGADVDLAEVLAVAAVHDLAEAVLGHPGREVRDKLRWEEVEEGVFRREFPHLAELFRWYRYETNTVGRIVAFADKLATLIRACRYRQLGYATEDLIKGLYKKLTAYDEFMHILEYFVRRYRRYKRVGNAAVPLYELIAATAPTSRLMEIAVLLEKAAPNAVELTALALQLHEYQYNGPDPEGVRSKIPDDVTAARLIATFIARLKALLLSHKGAKGGGL